MMKYTHIQFFFVLLLSLFVYSAHTVQAASLRVTPSTGVYTAQKTFSVSVLLNTEGKSVNASDGQLTFNPRELQVVSVSRASSIFNLWTEEPTFSNTAGTISFGGGSPTGYKGSGGSILSIMFKSLGAGTPKLQFTSGSILAADGLGTNILTSMTGGTYTVSAPSDIPAPEYIAPANTPKAPTVISLTHPDQAMWYKEKNAQLAWEIPSEVVAVRMLLDREPTTIPTVSYEERIVEKTVNDLEEGTSFFHLQFKNKEGWGRIAHFKLNVDTEAPTEFKINEKLNAEGEISLPTLQFSATDVSPILEYIIQLDGKDPFVFKDTEFVKEYAFTGISPGYHTISVEAFDSVGNGAIATHSFTVNALEKPIFIEYPTRINTEVIPAIKGKAIPHAHIAVQITRIGDGVLISTVEGDNGADQYALQTNENGEFTYIPDASFEPGVYAITAIAKNERGMLSEKSDEIRIIVEAPGYITLGNFVINVLSILVPLSALVLLLIFGTWYLWHKLSLWKRRVLKETHEAEASLTKEFNTVIQNLHSKITSLKESRKGKLTQAESELISQMEGDLKSAQSRISKEIGDIEDTIT